MNLASMGSHDRIRHNSRDYHSGSFYQIRSNIRVINGFENDTGSAWTDYHVKVNMDQPFNLSNAASNSLPVIGLPHLYSRAGSSSSGMYVGYIDYYAGTPVPNRRLSWIFDIRFLSPATVNYTQEIVPHTRTRHASASGLADSGPVGHSASFCLIKYKKIQIINHSPLLLRG